jgi:FtsP/CotA-like multicopper oxidase with cupredoxin domain
MMVDRRGMLRRSLRSSNPDLNRTSVCLEFPARNTLPFVNVEGGMRHKNQVVWVTCVAALFSLFWIERIDVEQFFGNFCTSSRTSFSHSGRAVASEAPTATATTAAAASPSATSYSTTPELLPLPICSAAAAHSGLKGCTITAKGGHNEIKVDLTAQNASVRVGGYDVTTENYGNYLTPVIVAMPGDTVAAHLENKLGPGMMAGGMATDDNPTNLHLFHGGIVPPKNGNSGQSPDRTQSGNGDNVYVRLDRGKSFDFEVPIPGKDMLDARVLEGKAGDYIAHPPGLAWYHSHLHMISTEQVIGGMSGLLSVGEPTASLKSCRPNPTTPSKCIDDSSDEDILKKRTEVKYVLLRDLPLQDVSKQPGEAENATATWAPTASLPAGKACGVFKQDGSVDPDVTQRKGFCQFSTTDAKGNAQKITWLFTLNGQRFPTITVEAGKNVLLRIGNLSANVGYWLEADNKDSQAKEKLLPLSLIGLDGIVPARPLPPGNADKPIAANNVPNLLLMPASRAEIYIRNDENKHDEEQDFILSSKGLNNIGPDDWPQVQLATIVLKPNPIANPLPLSLNAPVTTTVAALAARLAVENEKGPTGCTEDVNPALKEYRRVSFYDGPNIGSSWKLEMEVVRPKNGAIDDGTTVPGLAVDPLEDKAPPGFLGVPFEAYLDSNGHVDWMKKHTCIKLDHKGSHKQLWVLVNGTITLHNFHIHQMKFRLATKDELADHNIRPNRAHSCDPARPGDPPPDECNSGPNYDLYDDGSASPDPEAVRWHDTIPVPPSGDPVYVVMSFDASQQVGRFVFHCHILKHEDAGLMAPIEVWDPNSLAALP